jgi:hypothetical protein
MSMRSALQGSQVRVRKSESNSAVLRAHSTRGLAHCAHVLQLAYPLAELRPVCSLWRPHIYDRDKSLP